MDISAEKKDSKIIIKWSDVKCDYYKVFCGSKGILSECAKVKDTSEITLSLVPFGDSECYVQAIKNSQIVSETRKCQFTFDTIDVITRLEPDNNLKIFYSKFDGANGYRLYKSENNEGFSGYKNSDAEYITIPSPSPARFSAGEELLSAKNEPYNSGEVTEYKIKPFEMSESGERNMLVSSKAFRAGENGFKSTTIYRSYNYNFFLSWNYKGYADGFLVYVQGIDVPIFETNDGLRHYLNLTEFKGTSKFIVKAFVNTVNGRLVVAESKLTGMTLRKYEKPDVSLIIPAYNAKDYIARSIDSALASDFENLEIVIVNDGSTDDTQKIIDWYCKNYTNIVSIVKENGGVADTRNVGINAAKGKYIAFMDNDDLIRPDMISTLYNSAEKNSCDVAIAPLYRISDKGYSIHCDLPFDEDIAINIDDYLDIMYTKGYYNCAIWNKLYNAEMVKAHPLGKGLRYEDVSWTPCILSYAKNFCFIKTPFYEWDRKSRPETFGDFLAKKPENELYEHRKQAMLFFVQNGNPEKREYMKTIAKRRLARYSKNGTIKSYLDLADKIEKGQKID